MTVLFFRYRLGYTKSAIRWPCGQMNKQNITALFFSAVLIILSPVILLSVERYGRDSRSAGISYSLADPALDRATIDYPEEAYTLWKQRGFKGRVIISFSRRLNFVRLEADALIPPMSFPLQVFNLSNAAEGNLRPDNFLYIAMETGIARKIVHIVHESVLQEKIENARGSEGVTVGENRIQAPHVGSPRTIALMSSLRPFDEPVLVYVNASVFRDYDPEEFLRQLLKSGLYTDLMVLCRSYDDSEVTEKEREKLRIFEALLGGSGEKQ